MLWIYYALLKSNVMLLITVNSVGCFIETLDICFFLFYAPKKARMESLKLIVLLIVVGFGLIVVLTQFLASGVTRDMILFMLILQLIYMSRMTGLKGACSALKRKIDLDCS